MDSNPHSDSGSGWGLFDKIGLFSVVQSGLVHGFGGAAEDSPKRREVMTMWRRAFTLLLLSGLASPVCLGQATANDQKPADGQTPTIRMTTREVILDLIVVKFLEGPAAQRSPPERKRTQTQRSRSDSRINPARPPSKPPTGAREPQCYSKARPQPR